MFGQTRIPVEEKPTVTTYPYLVSSAINSASHSLNLVVQLRLVRAIAPSVVNLYQSRGTMRFPAFSVVMDAEIVASEHLSKLLRGVQILEHVNIAYFEELPNGKFKSVACRHYNLSARMVMMQVGKFSINLSDLQDTNDDVDEEEVA